MLLITLIPQAPWFGGLVLGPDFASDSQYDPSSGLLVLCVLSQGVVG